MLTLNISKKEFFDESADSFVYVEGATIMLEHSLLSISKWESKWKKPFLKTELKGTEFADYVKCMTITKGISDKVFLSLNSDEREAVLNYINDPMTATTFNDKKAKVSRKIITSEVIYYWMTEFGIPFECEKWHLNRLMTLIRVCGIEGSPSKKMSKKDAMAQQREIMAARRAGRKH